MFYLEYMDAEGVKQWELQAQSWLATRHMLRAYGVKSTTMESLNRLVAKDASEWHGHELDDLAAPFAGGCIVMEGCVGPMLQNEGDMHPLRRAGEFEAYCKTFEKGRKGGAREARSKLSKKLPGPGSAKTVISRIQRG